jgi:hypothetical protein
MSQMTRLEKKKSRRRVKIESSYAPANIALFFLLVVRFVKKSAQIFHLDCFFWTRLVLMINSTKISYYRNVTVSGTVGWTISTAREMSTKYLAVARPSG